MTETPALGDMIRESRLALGYSLGQLATKVGRTAATVRTWERGEAVPNEESREALVSVLDLDAAEFEALVPGERDVSEGHAAADSPDAADEAEAADELEFETSPAPEVAAETEPAPDADEAVMAGDDHPDEEDSDDEAAGVVVAAALVDAADSALEIPAVDDDDSSEIAVDLDDVETEADSSDESADESADDESSDEEPDEVSELPVVAAAAVPDDADDAADDTETAASDTAGDDADDTDDTLEGIAAVTPFEVDPALVDEPTEAVVVPVVATATGVATQTRSVVTVAEPKPRGTRNPLRILFDPKRRWLYRIRALFTLVVAVVLVLVLVWAAGELLDALGQVLDSIEPTEVDEDGIDALRRVRTLT